MSLLSSQGRNSLARDYRNLTERQIRARLEGELSDLERVTAKAELLRRGAADDGADTTFMSGFQTTSAIELDQMESVAAGTAPREAADDIPPLDAPARRVWPLLMLLSAGVAGAFAWAMHARLIRL